ncbi:MAG: hypothetical protein N2652_09810 [Kiritimatiellae bacterium]|nr:hypothetical protein [Kiritimatiellia bacterium]
MGRPLLGAWLLSTACGAAAPRDEILFTAAASNAQAAAEAWSRAYRQVRGWLAHADPTTGLFPRNLRDSPYWNGRDAAADNYPFMVLTAAMLGDEPLRHRLLELLRTEERLTSRVGRLPDDWLLATGSWRRARPEWDSLVFDGAEYVKDGLLAITEWLGPSPWSERMIGIIQDIWTLDTPLRPQGPLPTANLEVLGDLLQAGARLHRFTGDPRHLEWAIRIGDHLLLGDRHPARTPGRLVLSDHGCEIVNGLSELYVAVAHARPDRRDAYRSPLRELYETILRRGRDTNGFFWTWITLPDGPPSGRLTDNWGYNYDGIYTFQLLENIPDWRDEVRRALQNLPRLAGYFRDMDSLADSIEGALTLLRHEPVAAAAEYVEREIRAMWALQKPDGVVEGWHGDGNFTRTSLMFALWKTQGARLIPWREDLQLGAARDGQRLLLHLAARQAWRGRLLFDTPRHRELMRLPLDYPRINQFPEWFTVEPDATYALDDRTLTGRELAAGIELELRAEEVRRIRIQRR